jgi:hypothetical protein
MKSKKDLLVVVAKAKKHMKDKGYKVSEAALEKLSLFIAQELEKGALEAQKFNRKVIKDRDILKDKK